jgi:hypothetical protein
METKWCVTHVQTPLDNTIDISDVSTIINNSVTNIVSKEMYECMTESNFISIYPHVRELYAETSNDTKTLLLSSDSAVSSATISGFIERTMIPDDEGKFKSDSVILYIDSLLDMDTKHPDSIADMADSVVSSAFSFHDRSFTRHRLPLSTDNIVFIGTNEEYVQKEEFDMVKYTMNIPNYSINIKS